MKLAIAFVIYNADNTFLERLKIINVEDYDIFIFDNSPSESYIRLFSTLNKRIRYYTSGKNVGLGYGLSVVCSNAFYENFDFLLFFDQDTIFTNTTLDFAKNLIQSKNINDFAIISLNSKNQKNDNSEPKIIKKDLSISSGSIFNLTIANKLNWHNTDLFVDNVDYEFCLRAVNNGFFIGECNFVPEFDHISGQEDKEYYLFNKKYLLRSYSRIRIIDSLKSYIYLLRLSIATYNYKYFFLFIRSFAIFTYFQLLVRFLNITFIKKKN